MTPDRPRIHFYALDQCWDTTSSLGIYKHTRCLLAALAQGEDPGWDVVVSVQEREAARMLPKELPAWMSAHLETVPPGILGRIWADQVSAIRITGRLGAKLAFFPKGWVPFFPMRVPVVASVHDTIVFEYPKRYPGCFSKKKMRYFQFCTRNTLRKSRHVLTVSNYSREGLVELGDCVREKISQIPQSSTLPEQTDGAQTRGGLLVYGSNLPHKCTLQTLAHLDAYAQKTGFNEPVWVVGSIPAFTPKHCRINYLGRVSDDELAAKLREVRAVVHLSELEGFGLPLLEAYAQRTPVLFRDAHSFHELLGSDDPGAWDGRDESFASKLSAVLALTPAQILETRTRLFSKYSWSRAAQVFRKTVQAFVEGGSA